MLNASIVTASCKAERLFISKISMFTRLPTILPRCNFRIQIRTQKSFMSELTASSSAKISSPQPDWKPGDKQPHPFGDAEFKALNPLELPSSYFLVISGVVPRPIAFVSSISGAGVGNLAPFSYFGVVAHDPPTVCVGICHKKDGTKKDTLVNIEETGEFVVNIISDWFVEAANQTCGEYAPEIDEFDLSGLTRLPSLQVAPPRVAESAFHMECKLTTKQEIVNDQGVITSTVVFGRVVQFHVLEPLLEAGPRGLPQVNFEGYRPLGRLGGDTWAKQGDRFDIDRPSR